MIGWPGVKRLTTGARESESRDSRLKFKCNAGVFKVSRESLTIQPFRGTRRPPPSAVFLTEYKSSALFESIH